MIKMQSPTPNRKGVYEIHDVPSRRVEALRAAGWTEIKPEKKTEEKPAVKRAYKKKTRSKSA